MLTLLNELGSKQVDLVDLEEEWIEAMQDIARDIAEMENGCVELDDIAWCLNRSVRFGHVFVPDGGGMDYVVAGRSSEPRCLELATDWPATSDALRFRPHRLSVTRFFDAPLESFLHIENEPLERVLDDLGGNLAQEYLVEDGSGGVVHEDMEGFAGRTIVRVLRGNLVIASKQSIWNLSGYGYSGHKEDDSAEDVRRFIQGAAKRANDRGVGVVLFFGEGPGRGRGLGLFCVETVNGHRLWSTGSKVGGGLKRDHFSDPAFVCV